MILRLIVQTAIWLAATGALLFVPAGTFDWPGAWVLLAEMACLAAVVGLWLARHDAALLRERLSSVVQADQKAWDRLLMTALVLVWCGWFVLMGLDIANHGISQVPTPLQVLGALGIALCGRLALAAFRENSFAAPVVKTQDDRGHAVVTTGPYALVRHPMYAGAIPYFVGASLLLGSLWGLALAPLMIAVLALRAVMEERTLCTEVAGYADYAARVRYRLIPFIW